MPRKAWLGAFTILIKLYQNCFASFSYGEAIEIIESQALISTFPFLQKIIAHAYLYQ
jgi:hypothetical protein